MNKHSTYDPMIIMSVDSLILNNGGSVLKKLVEDEDNSIITSLISKMPKIILDRLEELMEDKYDEIEFQTLLNNVDSMSNIIPVNSPVFSDVKYYKELIERITELLSINNVTADNLNLFGDILDDFDKISVNKTSYNPSLKEILKVNMERIVYFLNPIEFDISVTDCLNLKDELSEDETIFNIAKMIILYKIVADFVLYKRLAMFYKECMQVGDTDSFVFEDEIYTIRSMPSDVNFNVECDDIDLSTEAKTATGEKDLDKKKELKDLEDEEEKSIDNKMANAKLKQRKFFKKVKDVWKKVTGQAGFYKKYIGRIDGLMEHYGSIAELKENEMFGDPVVLLTGRAQHYIKYVVKSFQKLHDDVMNTANKVASSITLEGQIRAAKSFIGKDFKEDDKNYGKMFYSAFMRKVGSILLEKGELKVYGYTIDSIAENYKLPPPNHLIVSLFVRNPHEEPKIRSVNDIFEGPGSFKIMSDVNKIPIYEISDISSKTVADTGSKNEIHKINELHIKSFTNAKSMLSGLSGEDKAAARRKLNATESLWKSIKASLKEFIAFKFYIISCGDVYSNMVDRVDTLCRQAISEMLIIEKGEKDERHGTGFGGSSYGEINKNLQNKNDTKQQSYTLAEKATMAARDADDSKVLGKVARTVANVKDRVGGSGDVKVAGKMIDSEKADAINNRNEANDNLRKAAIDAKKALDINQGRRRR